MIIDLYDIFLLLVTEERTKNDVKSIFAEYKNRLIKEQKNNQSYSGIYTLLFFIFTEI
jgi:hypothetical protein